VLGKRTEKGSNSIGKVEDIEKDKPAAGSAVIIDKLLEREI